MFALIGRLRTSVGALVGLETPHALEQPTVIVEEVLHGVLTWPTLAELGNPDRGLSIAATRAAAITLDVPWPDVARAVWLAWDAAERPAEGADFLLPENDSEGLFWAHIPRELLRPAAGRRRARQANARSSVCAMSRGRRSKKRVLAGSLAVTAEMVQHAPEGVLDNWLARRGLEPFAGQALGMLWQRVPERLLRVLSLHLEKPNPAETAQVVALLTELPTSLLNDAVAQMADKQLVRLPGAALGAVRRLLHRAVSEGGALGRRAYPALAGLEEKLSVSRRT